MFILLCLLGLATAKILELDAPTTIHAGRNNFTIRGTAWTCVKVYQYSVPGEATVRCAQRIEGTFGRPAVCTKIFLAGAEPGVSNCRRSFAQDNMTTSIWEHIVVDPGIWTDITTCLWFPNPIVDATHWPKPLPRIFTNRTIAPEIRRMQFAYTAHRARRISGDIDTSIRCRRHFDTCEITSDRGLHYETCSYEAAPMILDNIPHCGGVEYGLCVTTSGFPNFTAKQFSGMVVLPDDAPTPRGSVDPLVIPVMTVGISLIVLYLKAKRLWFIWPSFFVLNLLNMVAVHSPTSATIACAALIWFYIYTCFAFAHQ